MSLTKTKTGTTVDPRTWLVHLLIGVAAIIFIHSNMGGLLLFAWSMLLQLTMRKGQYLLPFLFAYIVLTGFAWIGVQLLPDDRFYFLGLAFSNMGVIGRKAMVPLSFATVLWRKRTVSAHTGTRRISHSTLTEWRSISPPSSRRPLRSWRKHICLNFSTEGLPLCRKSRRGASMRATFSA